MEEEKCCYDCMNIIDNDATSYEIGENRIVCEICYENNYFMCYSCSNVYNIDESYMVNSDLYCEDCYTESFGSCEECGMDEALEYLNYNQQVESYFCDDCYPNTICAECNIELYNIDRYSRNGFIYCYSCYNELVEHVDIQQSNEENLIQGYHNTHDWTKYGDDCNTYFGIELEVERSNSETRLKDAAKGVNDILGKYVVFQQDGSLNDGFEIIFQPMTYNFILSIQDKIEEALKYLMSIGYKSHNPGTCGLHIHVSRTDLNDRIIDNILLLHENFIDELILFSRRKEHHINQYSQFLSKYKRHSGRVLTLKYLSENKYSQMSRYTAVNLCNDRTIEFRLYRGTLKFSTFMASLILTNNIVNICKNNNSLNNITWSQLLNNNKTAQNYCKERGIKGYRRCKEMIIKFVERVDGCIYLEIVPYGTSIEYLIRDTNNILLKTEDSVLFIKEYIKYVKIWEKQYGSVYELPTLGMNTEHFRVSVGSRATYLSNQRQVAEIFTILEILKQKLEGRL